MSDLVITATEKGLFADDNCLVTAFTEQKKLEIIEAFKHSLWKSK